MTDNQGGDIEMGRDPKGQEEFHINPEKDLDAAPQPSAQSAYPTTVDPEVQKENEKHAKQEEQAAASSALNCLPALAGKTDRQKFTIKVFSICLCQIMVTVAAVAMTKIFPGVAKFMKANMWLEIVAMVVGFILLIFVLCFK